MFLKKDDLDLVTDGGLPLMIVDPVIKKIFKDNPNVLAKLISDIADYNYYELENNIDILSDDILISTRNEKAKRCDFLVKIDNNKYTNIEMNNYSSKVDLIKNLSYVFHIYSSVTKKGNKYKNELELSQINLDYHAFNMNKSLTKYYLMNNEKEILTKSLIIYFLNIEKCYKIWYNCSDKDNLSNYIKWGAFFASGKYSEMKDILSQLVTDKECMKIMSSLENIRFEDLDWSEEEWAEWDQWMENSSEDIKRLKLEEGLAEGRKQEKINNIKAMLKNGADYDFISKVTNKSIKEIKEIEESIDNR